MDDLLDRIAAGPDQEIELLRVHADQLIQRGDPFGELIVVATQRLAADSPELSRREAALIAEREAEIMAALARPMSTYKWRRGFLDTVVLPHHGERLEHALPRLVARPEARLLRRIEIDILEFDTHGDLGPVFAELARLAPRLPRLREVVVHEGIDGPIVLGDVRPLYAAFPLLEVLELSGERVELGEISFPELRRLKATHLRLDDTRRLVAAQLPRLADLELAFHRGSFDNLAAQLGPLLHREFPQLEALSLSIPGAQVNAATHWMIQELIECPLTRQVRRLAFRHDSLDDGSISILIDEAPRLRRLERLELYTRPLSASLQRQLRRTYGTVLALV